MDAHDLILLALAADNGRAALQATLETAGFRVATVETGRDALVRLRETRPRFLGCGLRLPDMDGYELCRRARSSREHDTLPIGLFVASQPEAKLEALVRSGLECGADALLSLAPDAAAATAERIAYLTRRRPTASAELAPPSDAQTQHHGRLLRSGSGWRRATDFLLSVLELRAEGPDQSRRGVARTDELFLNDLGHDIHDKIYSMLALADFALEGETTERQRALAQTVRQAVDMLLAPLNELVALYRAAHLPGRAEDGGVTTTSPAEGRKILLVEDNPINKDFVVRLLDRDGHRVMAVENGREALDALMAEAFDAVLMDIQMPVMDGLQATAAIRRGETDVPGRSNRCVPIIALTAYAMSGDRERFLAAGMDEYLTKPLDMDVFHEVLIRILQPTPDKAPARADAACNPAVLDRAKTLVRLRGDEKFLNLLYATFTIDSGERLGRFRAALDVGDFAGLQKQAHSLKGVAATLDAGQLREAAYELELAAREQNPAQTAAAFASLVDKLGELEVLLARFLGVDG